MNDISQQLFRLKLNATKANGNNFLHESALSRTQQSIIKQLAKEEKMRINIFRHVEAFAGVPDEFLKFAAQNMEENYYSRNDVVIAQGDIGDAFYIVERGTLSVSTKLNPSNTAEAPNVVARLTENSHFGELALLTAEPRSATITVSSDSAKLLMMKKTKFDEIISNCKNILKDTRGQIHKEIVNRVPIFHSLATVNKKRITDAMVPVFFSPGAYICKQGAQGNNFYILTEGSCKVTIRKDDNVERELPTLRPGDFFGEIALIDSSQKRTASVIALTEVACMTLSRASFESLLKGMESVLMQASASRQTVRRQRKDSLKSKPQEKRLFTGCDDRGFMNPTRVDGLFRRVTRFMVESLYCSMYARLYKEVMIDPSKANDVGDTASFAFQSYMSREESLMAIRTRVLEIFQADTHRRTPSDHMLIVALLRQKNSLKDRVCKDWMSYQYAELCRKLKIVKIEPLQRIYEIDARGTTAFLVLRGSVRLFGTGNSAVSGSRIPKAEEDLVAGDVFGETVFEGLHTRQLSAMALTVCDLAVIEAEDFIGVLEGGSKKLSVDARYRFLSQVSMFKDWEHYRIIRIAQSLQQEEYPKGAVLIRKDEVSRKLYFLYSGRVNIQHDLNAPNDILTLISPYDYLGESGFVNLSDIVKGLPAVTECCYAVAHNRIDVFTLAEDVFPLFDADTLSCICTSFHEKLFLRGNRAKVLHIERKKQKKKELHMIQNRRRREREESLLTPQQLTVLRERKKAAELAKLQAKQAAHEDTLPPLIDVEDIPSVISECVSDPLLILGTCRSEAEVRSTFQSLRETPRSRSRSISRSMSRRLSIESTASSSTIGIGADGTATVTTPNTARSISSAGSAFTLGESSANGGAIFPLLPGAYLAAGCSESNKDFPPITPSSGVRIVGSTRIPNIKSYYEVLTAAEALLVPSRAKTPRSSADAPFHLMSTTWPSPSRYGSLNMSMSRGSDNNSLAATSSLTTVPSIEHVPILQEIRRRDSMMSQSTLQSITTTVSVNPALVPNDKMSTAIVPVGPRRGSLCRTTTPAMLSTNSLGLGSISASMSSLPRGDDSVSSSLNSSTSQSSLSKQDSITRIKTPLLPWRNDNTSRVRTTPARPRMGIAKLR
eukprot:gene1275-2462_t